MEQTTNIRNALEQACSPLLNESKTMLEWNWDERFDAILCEFSSDKQEQVLSLLSRHFPIQWNASSIKKAPPQIRQQSGIFAELRKGQMLFTNDPEEPNKLFAAIWPWGHGATVSLRILFPREGEPVKPWYKKLFPFI